jgi:hypothetical protein
MTRDIKKEIEFIEGVARLGKKLGIPPGDSLVLFGRLARGFVEHAHAKGDSGKNYEELVESAMNRFATGLGGAVSHVTIESAPDAKDLH